MLALYSSTLTPISHSTTKHDGRPEPSTWSGCRLVETSGTERPLKSLSSTMRMPSTWIAVLSCACASLLLLALNGTDREPPGGPRIEVSLAYLYSGGLAPPSASMRLARPSAGLSLNSPALSAPASVRVAEVYASDATRKPCRISTASLQSW